MKYKVIAYIDDPILASSKQIMCVAGNSLSDGEGNVLDVSVGQTLSGKKLLEVADTYWRYSKKEWQQINKEFMKVK